MSISLQKKQSLSLAKAAPQLRNLVVELSWNADANKLAKGGTFDADLSAFICKGGKVIDDVYACFFNNPETADHSVKAIDGDSRGTGGNGKERIQVDLSKVTAEADEIVFVATIDRADERKQNYGQITTGSIKAINEADGATLCEFKYGDGTYTNETAIQVAALVRNGNAWDFKAIGEGGVKDFIAIATQDFGFPA